MKKRKGQWTVQNVGHPKTTVQESDWKDLSYHASMKAAFRKIDKCKAHLDYGQWDDHYRILDQDGNPIDMYKERCRIIGEQTEKEFSRGRRL